MDFLKKNSILIFLFLISLGTTIYLYTIPYTFEEKPNIRPDTQEEPQQSDIPQKIIEKEEESIHYRIQKEDQKQPPSTSDILPAAPPLPIETSTFEEVSSPPIEKKESSLLSATLSVPSIGYTNTIDLPVGSTVYDLMKALEAHGLNFGEDDYGELGVFVTKIGPLSNDYKQRKFWIYSINGKKATIGVSHYILTPHDIISWTYEQEDL